MNRRTFIGALGATAASAVFLEQFAKGQDGTIYYEDSFGNIVPASPDTIAVGIYPPTMVSGPASGPVPSAPGGRPVKPWKPLIPRTFRQATRSRIS